MMNQAEKLGYVLQRSKLPKAVTVEALAELGALVRKATILDWIGENGAAFFLLSDCGGFCTWEEICAEIRKRIKDD